jgi:putative transcriptional regulator
MARFSLEDIENARPENPERLASTTEEEIQRQITEDGGFDMGEVDPSRLTVRQSYPDPRQLRHRLNMTQEEFSRAFGLNIWTLRDWEQHKAEPEGPARTLLRVIAQNPEVVRRAVAAA